MTAENRRQYVAFYAAEDSVRWGRSEMLEEKRITRDWLIQTGVDADAVVLELGCGMGALADLHPGYIGLDFSLGALGRFQIPVPRLQGDMQSLPIRSGSADFVFTWAALEHVPDPAAALLEISRIVRPGGVLVLAPAWNVRPWASRALPVRRYRELTVRDRMTKATIPLRESLLWRALASLPGRLWREFRLLIGGRVAFSYRRLSPNMGEYIYTDSDAFTAMDPHTALTYFLSRGWEALSHSNWRRRLLVRHGAVVVRRPAST